MGAVRRGWGVRALIVASVLTGLLGLLGPEIPALIARARCGKRPGSTACPLGYGGGDASSPGWPHPGSAAPPLGSAPLLFFVNATVWTGDEAAPWADSFAVDARGVLQAVGRGLTPAPTSAVHDLSGAFVMPGIVDAHIHLIPGGLVLGYANLRAAASRDAFREGVAAAAQKLPRGAWVMGGLFDDNAWGGGLPDTTWLEGVTGGRPAWITRMDGHLGVANAEAMALAGVGAATPTPEGGVLDRGPDGTPTGVFRESAMALITSHIPEPTPAERAAALAAAAEYLLSKGTTTVTDLGRAPFAGLEATWNDLEQVLDPAAAAGQLPIRVQAFVPLATWGRLATRVAAKGRAHKGGRLLWGGVKEFHDGSLGSRTALMWEPYTDDGSTNGTSVTPLAELGRNMAAADAAGLQIAVHAIGDRAVDEVLDLYQALADARPDAPAGPPSSRPRHRIEHAQHLSGPAAAARFAALNVIAVGNPLHLLTDRHMLVRRLGALRAVPGRAFPYRSLLDAGAHLAHASDWPVVDLDPMGSYYAAAFRREAGDGELPVVSEQVPIGEALLGHTTRAADAAGLGHLVGRLRAGLRADFAVLSASPLDLVGDVAEALPRFVETWVDGRCAWPAACRERAEVPAEGAADGAGGGRASGREL